MENAYLIFFGMGIIIGIEAFFIWKIKILLDDKCKDYEGVLSVLSDVRARRDKLEDELKIYKTFRINHYISKYRQEKKAREKMEEKLKKLETIVNCEKKG